VNPLTVSGSGVNPRTASAGARASHLARMSAQSSFVLPFAPPSDVRENDERCACVFFVGGERAGAGTTSSARSTRTAASRSGGDAVNTSLIVRAT
jgi:hypothetical protein